jgi:hypothetical protein
MPKMADIPVPRYHAFWTDTQVKVGIPTTDRTIPDADAHLKQLLKVFRDIEEMARYTPDSVGESEQWSTIVSTAEENRQNFCKVVNGKNLLNALYGTYTVALHELKAVLKASTSAGQSLTHRSPLPPRRSGGVNDTRQMRVPQLQRKQRFPP